MRPVSTIPQRELRNNVSSILHRAEKGERFTVTVNGRPVAEVGPIGAPRGPAEPARLAEILRDNPVDSGWREDLERTRREDEEAAQVRADEEAARVHRKA